MTFEATTWQQVLEVLEQEPAGTVLRVRKHWLPHPEDSGATRSFGLPLGQSADFRWRLGDCAGLHARDFHSHYEVHLDQVHPACGFVEHLRQDAPGTYRGGAAVLGALAGAILGRSKESALVGAGLGALIGALTSRQTESDSEALA